MNILLVDDTKLALDAAKTFIDYIVPNQNIDLADSAETALRMIDNKQYDLIITDLCMPGMNGDVLIKTIRTTDNKSKLARIFICSSRKLSPEEEQNIKLHANGFLDKPLIPEVLEDIF